MNKRIKRTLSSRFRRVMAFGSALTIAATTTATMGCTSETVENSKAENLKSEEQFQFPADLTNVTKLDGEGRPNIVYIVMDDMGFSDLGCYGSEINTPNIDKLAENGIRYTNFNVTPVSSPTRASLLTGRNHHSIGMGSISNIDLGPDMPNYRGRITSSAATAGEVLKENGYNTFAVGKWHLTPSHQTGPAGPYDNWPLSKGFERFYGFLEGSTDQLLPELIYDNHYVDIPDIPGYHASVDLVDKAVEFVNTQTSVTPEKPFFLYLAFGAQHAPHQAPQEYIDKYKGVYDKGWDEIRKERLARQNEMGIVPQNTELTSRNPGVKAWDELTPDQTRLYARFMETYAGFLDHTDEQIGRLVDYLESIDELDNTMIVFLSDNGASQEGQVEGSINHSSPFNGLPETTEGMLPYIEEIGGAHTHANYPWGWAQVSNTPFQRYKQNTHLGGVRVPLIIQWPEGIKDKGRIRTQFHHAIDVTPTVYDILNIEAPKIVKGVEQMPIHGVSMKYTFDDPKADTMRPTQYFMMGAHRSIWNDGWMASVWHKKGTPFEKDKWELYNLNEDFAQAHDLAEQYPDKLKEMQELWLTEAEKYGALPLLDKTYELLAVVSPDSVVNRKTFTYLEGTPYISAPAAAAINNRSHKITAYVDRDDKNDEGVLVALGSHSSGYTLYIKDNKLVYEYNFPGKIFKIESDVEVPLGKVELQFEYKKEGMLNGIGSIYINDKKVGEAPIKTLPLRTSHEGLDIGKDSRSPVTSSYHDEGEFPFTGKLEKVVIDVEDDFAKGNKQ